MSSIRPTMATLAAIGLLLFATVVQAQERLSTPLNGAWRFICEDVAAALKPGFDDTNWSEIRLPHTWNGSDGEDGGGYYRGPGWYRTTFDAPLPGRRLWLEFDGAALATEVFVNGVFVGRHEGGYARFRFDATGAVQPGPNVLAVKVDNSPVATIAPLGGDFTVFGGLYRPVRLIEVGPVHIDLSDYGGPGVTMTPTHVTTASADLALSARVANDGSARARGRVQWRLIDADGTEALRLEASFEVSSGQIAQMDRSARLVSPRLWQERRDPHLYTLETTVLDVHGAPLDQLSLRTGVRDFRVDPDQGATLNGRPAPLYGVNYFHSGRPGRGLAVQDWEIDQDFDIMREMGSSALRFVHFQHPQRAYDLADAQGLMVWTEVPLNAAVDPSPEFSANLVQQMRELIRQNRHHPSVVIWGLGNEVYSTEDPADAAIALMQATAKAEDPGRPTAYAHCCQDDLDRKALHADLTAYNRYFGWYDGEFDRIGAWADERRARDPARPTAVSEFGAGASVLQQQLPPDRPIPDGAWHPEQYQTAFHEAYWRELRERPWLWSNFVWVGFDLASDGRDEGDRPGINDKGLVTYDRLTRKDAWYWYQANWSDTPMAHIVNGRLTERSATTSVRVFSNQSELRLIVQGHEIGQAVVVDQVAEWSAVPLTPGLNRIEIHGPSGLLDTVWWTRP